MLKLGLSDTFVIVDSSVADELDLRNSRYCLQVGMDDVLLRSVNFVVAVAVVITGGVKRLQIIDFRL